MSRPLSRTLAAALVATLAATSLALAGAAPATAADGTVTGTVFRDFNANGVLDTATARGIAIDTGFGGVTVTAYDSDGGPSWTTTSAADGSYSIPVTNATGNAVRIEFTGLPTGYQPGAVASTGSANGTSVQFVNLGATGVDFAVNAPEDYSQGNAPLATAIQWAGSPFVSEGGTKTTEPAVAAVPYSRGYTSGTQPGGFPNRVTLATFGEVGAVSSEVYQPSSNSIFVSAVVKRQSGLGSLGAGGIYRITDVMNASGAASGAGSVLPWLDVTDLGINVGTVPSNTDRGISGHQTQTNDTAGFALSGKAGIGDMALSSDGRTLYFVNLFDKKLYALDVSDPTTPPTTFQVIDLGLGDGDRPWALTIYRGDLYVGYVETGETAAGAQPGSSAAAADLDFHVMRAPLATLSGWTDVLTGDLGYTKGDVYQNVLAPQSQRWNTWTDTWTWTGGRVAQANGGWHIYPQAVLSDLYFDEDGYLSLGFIDRTSLQGANRNLASDPSVPGGNYETGASGDLLIAAPAGNGTFTLEANGVVGTRTTLGGNAAEGPGGREFYDDTHNLSAGANHKEVTLGYLAGLRGTREVVSTAYDPLAGIRLAGLMWFDIDNGDSAAGYELNGDGESDGSGGNFQKGGGLGGISALAEAAPVEVGNRVWFDTDKDGIQDPDEPPIAGLTVQLLQGGAIIGTATTDANGEYYFSSDPASAFYAEGLEPNGGDYSIQFVKPTTGNLTTPSGPAAWNTVAFTTAETTSTETGSNPDPATGRYTFTVGGPGENNHSIDAGFVVNLVPAVDIEKGDNGGSGTAIVNDADTMADGETYAPGESRTVVFTVTNSGTEPLREVLLTDETLAGAGVQSLTWTFPDSSTATATTEDGVLTARWEDTFGTGTAEWAPGTVITGTATLTLAAGSAPHVDSARVTAVGATSNDPVEDEDAYNAFIAGIQVIKYDGQRPDPEVGSQAAGWVTPVKPLVDAAQDANTVDDSVVYPVNTPQAVRWVVTNTGPTSLTNITLTDVTDNGPAIGGDWTADLRAFGGPEKYSFVNDGPWDGVLPPGASFFAQGTLQLAASQTHADTVTVVGTVVVPEVDVNGVPTGNPSLDGNGDPIVALDDDGQPVTLDDDDPFHARTGVGPFVDIEKGDGSGTTIINDADTMADGEVYTSGETREIVFIAENTGDEALREVTLTENALSGAEVVALEWTFPDGSTATAQEVGGVLTAEWGATFGAGTATWLPGEKITGKATLTINAAQDTHVDLATVNAIGALSSIPVEDEDPYNAFTGAIQVIKYDGDLPDPVVRNGTNWVIPTKPLVGATQDANTDALAVSLKAGAANKVRWVVTNMGDTYLTHLELKDVTDSGPAITGDWTADLSPFGGPTDYSFVKDGPWDGVLPPGASFFAEGKLTLATGDQHADTVTVVGQVVVPEVDSSGLPTGNPSRDVDGELVVAERNGVPFTVTDNDPYHARVPGLLASTGWNGGTAVILSLLLLAGGALLLLDKRRRLAGAHRRH